MISIKDKENVRPLLLSTRRGFRGKENYVDDNFCLVASYIQFPCVLDKIRLCGLI